MDAYDFIGISIIQCSMKDPQYWWWKASTIWQVYSCYVKLHLESGFPGADDKYIWQTTLCQESAPWRYKSSWVPRTGFHQVSIIQFMKQHASITSAKNPLLDCLRLFSGENWYRLNSSWFALTTIVWKHVGSHFTVTSDLGSFIFTLLVFCHEYLSASTR